MTRRAEVVPLGEMGYSRHDQRSGEEYARDLVLEAEASLRKDPERWRLARMADPDEHRRRAPRQPWRGKP